MIRWASHRPRPLQQQPAALLAAGWLTVAGLGALLAPVLAPAGPVIADPAHQFTPPGLGRLLGTDYLGRDVLARLLWGGRWTLGLGVVALSVSVGLGLPAGLAAGYLGRRADAVLMRLVDALLAFPSLLLAMAVVALLGRGLLSIALAVGLAAAPAYVRVARTTARDVRSRAYVEAGQALGSNTLRILVHHVIPNSAAPLLAFAATQLGWVLLNGAALSFLGLGASPTTPEWGAMLAEGRAYVRAAPWVSAFPGLALTLTVLAANLLSDGIQESLRTH